MLTGGDGVTKGVTVFVRVSSGSVKLSGYLPASLAKVQMVSAQSLIVRGDRAAGVAYGLSLLQLQPPKERRGPEMNLTRCWCSRLEKVVW